MDSVYDVTTEYIQVTVLGPDRLSIPEIHKLSSEWECRIMKLALCTEVNDK